MKQITKYILDYEGLMMELNRGKDMILRQLVSDGVISKEDSIKFSKEYSIIVLKPSIISSLWAKILKKPDEYRYVMCKNLSADDWGSEDGN